MNSAKRSTVRLREMNPRVGTLGALELTTLFVTGVGRGVRVRGAVVCVAGVTGAVRGCGILAARSVTHSADRRKAKFFMVVLTLRVRFARKGGKIPRRCGGITRSVVSIM